MFKQTLLYYIIKMLRRIKPLPLIVKHPYSHGIYAFTTTTFFFFQKEKKCGSFIYILPIFIYTMMHFNMVIYNIGVVLIYQLWDLV